MMRRRVARRGIQIKEIGEPNEGEDGVICRATLVSLVEVSWTCGTASSATVP